MPKLGAEPIRKAALINAAIAAVGRAGSLDVTVAQIAREAGMSPALAHHYFGSKDQMFLAAMRHILTRYGESVRLALAGARDPRDRLRAIVAGSFDEDSFRRETISAWLNFYALAQVNGEAARLLRVYRRRLRSNLLHELGALCPDRAEGVAETMGALIDGVYIRAALSPGAMTGRRAATIVTGYLDEVLK